MSRAHEDDLGRQRAAGPSAAPFNWRLALASVAIGCAYLAVSWHISGPIYLRDEIGYLANAAFLTGHRIDAASSYHAGYSFLITPAFLFSDPRVVWKGVLTINAALWAANFAMLYAILRRVLPHVQPSRLLTTTIVSALYPTWIVSSGYALATTAFVTVFLASLLALFLWSRDKPLSILPHTRTRRISLLGASDRRRSRARVGAGGGARGLAVA